MEGGRASFTNLLVTLIGLALPALVLSANCITLNKNDPEADFFVQFDGIEDEGRVPYYSYIYYKNGPDGKKVLFLGSSDTIYSVDPDTFDEMWRVTIPSFVVEFACEDLAGEENEGIFCRNHISLIEKIESSWLVCGSNALTPACWRCNDTTEPWTCSRADDIEDVNLFIPRRPRFTSTWLYSEPWAFAGTERITHDMSFFKKLDAAASLETLLRNDPHQENWLNNPAYIGAPIEYGGYIYFFFRETATEYVNAGKIIYSRVGRVCKNNTLTPKHSTFRNLFQTMVKARLNCSIDLSFPFYFNELQDIFVSDRADGDKIIYSVFTTPGEGPPASAVCAYSLQEIEYIFNRVARYKGQHESRDDWLPKSYSFFGLPQRFGMCGQPYTATDAQRRAVKNYNLVDQLVPNLRDVTRKDLVPPEGSSPALRDSDSPIIYLNNYRFTSIAKVADDENGSWIVLMVGTDNKRLLKIAFKPKMMKGEYGQKVAEIKLAEKLESDVPNAVRDMVVHEQGDETYVIVTAVSDAFKVNVKFCHIYTTCEDCRRVEDPHCYWDNRTNVCKSNRQLQGELVPYTQCTVYGGSPDVDVVKSFVESQSVSSSKSHVVNEYSLVVAKKGSKLEVHNPSSKGEWNQTVIHRGSTPETEYYAIRLQGDSKQVKNVTFNVTLDDTAEMTITTSVNVDGSELCSERQAGLIFKYDCQLAQYEHKMSKIRQDILEDCAKNGNSGSVFQCPNARFEGDRDSYSCPAE